jgi:hypothetical protein
LNFILKFLKLKIDLSIDPKMDPSIDPKMDSAIELRSGRKVERINNTKSVNEIKTEQPKNDTYIDLDSLTTVEKVFILLKRYIKRYKINNPRKRALQEAMMFFNWGNHKLAISRLQRIEFGKDGKVNRVEIQELVELLEDIFRYRLVVKILTIAIGKYKEEGDYSEVLENLYEEFNKNLIILGVFLDERITVGPCGEISNEDKKELLDLLIEIFESEDESEDESAEPTDAEDEEEETEVVESEAADESEETEAVESEEEDDETHSCFRRILQI